MNVTAQSKRCAFTTVALAIGGIMTQAETKVLTAYIPLPLADMVCLRILLPLFYPRSSRLP